MYATRLFNRRAFGHLAVGLLATTALTRCQPMAAPQPATTSPAAGGAIAQAADGLKLIDQALQGVLPKLGLSGGTLANVIAKVEKFSTLAGDAARAVSAMAQQPLVAEAVKLLPAIVTLIPGGAAAAPVLEAALIFLPKIAALAGVAAPAAHLGRVSMSPDQAEVVLRRAVAG